MMKLGAAAALVGSILLVLAANTWRTGSVPRFRWHSLREAPLEAQLEKVATGTITHVIEAPGQVKADVEVNVSAQVTGRIVSLPVKEGDVVKKGDLLAKLDSVDFEAEVRAATAKVDRLRSAIELAKFDLEKSQRDLARTEKLLQTKAVGATEVDDLRTQAHKDVVTLAMREAELVEAEGELDRAKENLRDTSILAPVDGIVSKLIAKEGEVVIVGTINIPGTVIMIVSDLATRGVIAQVDETDVPLVRPGQKATIHLQDRKIPPLSGTVDRITPKGEKWIRGFGANQSDVASFETFVKIDDPTDAVRLGMTANVDLTVSERTGVPRIPAQAVVHRRLKDLPARIADPLRQEGSAGSDEKNPAKRYHQIVFVVEENKARARVIRTGISDERYVEVTDGLRVGEEIVVGPYSVLEKLKEGVALRPATMDEDP